MAPDDTYFQSLHRNFLATMSWRSVGRMLRADHLYLCIHKPLCKAVTKASCHPTDFLRISGQEKYWMKWECIALMETLRQTPFHHTG